MDGLRAHLPPSERRRRLLLLLPVLVGLSVLVVRACIPARPPADYDKLQALIVMAVLTASLAPLLGLGLWHLSSDQQFQERTASVSAEGLLVQRRIGGHRLVPWSEFEAFAIVRARGIPFALLTPRDGGATWVLKAEREPYETLIAAMQGRPAGEARFVYQAADGRGGCLSVWVVCTVMLVLVPVLWNALSPTGISYFGYCFALAYPLHSLVSLVLFGALLTQRAAWARLRILGSDCSLVLPANSRNVSCVKVDPAAIRGRTEIGDLPDFPGGRFALPLGLLTPGLQLQIIEQLLPPDEPRPEQPQKEA